MNQSQYLQELINAVEANSTVTISGTLDENLKQIGGTNIDVNSGSKSVGTQRICIATDDVNLSAIKTDTDELYACIDHVNHHVETDFNAINGVMTSVNSGNKDNGCQRVCIASDDVNTSSMSGNIFIMSQTVDGATTSKLKVKLMDTAGNSVNVTSNALNTNISSVTSGVFVPVNSVQIGGVSLSTGSGVNGTGVQRVSIANDDQSNYFKLEPRFQAFSYTSTNWRTHIIGGIAPNIPSTDWIVFPNDSTPTYTKDNVIPPLNSGMQITFSDQNDIDVVGIGYVYLNWTTGSGTTINNTQLSIGTNPQTLSPTITTLKECLDMYYPYPNPIGGPGSNILNLGSITLDDNNGHYSAWIPPLYGTCAKWFVQIPINGSSKIFLHELNCTCSHATNGFRIEIVRRSFNFTASSPILLLHQVLFKDYVLPNSTKKIDLSYIQTLIWQSGFNPNTSKDIIVLLAQGGTDASPAASSGSAFLTVSTYRV